MEPSTLFLYVPAAAACAAILLIAAAVAHRDAAAPARPEPKAPPAPLTYNDLRKAWPGRPLVHDGRVVRAIGITPTGEVLVIASDSGRIDIVSLADLRWATAADAEAK
jgi:hypothetical protein